MVLPVRSPHVGWKHRNKYARQARDFIKSHLAEFIRIERICQALGVSARTLEYSFQDIFQAGPLEYLKCRRLNAVRSQLLKADRPPLTVTQIAMNHGFGYLSYFSRDYKALFDESPPKTLSRMRR